MDGSFIDIIRAARAAVIVKDGGGYCVYANRRQEELRGCGRGDLLNKHITELVDADPLLVEREFERFKRDGTWIGHYRTHNVIGQVLRFRACNFTHREWDGNALYVSFAYPLKERRTFDKEGTKQLVPSSMSAENICIAQFCVDGYSEEEMSILLGTTHEAVGRLLDRFVQSIGAASRTEACVRALKTSLVA
jgi:hypothetical protein